LHLHTKHSDFVEASIRVWICSEIDRITMNHYNFGKSYSFVVFQIVCFVKFTVNSSIHLQCSFSQNHKGT
jgi:hypothetical protein